MSSVESPVEERDRIRQVNSLRFAWHEMILKDRDLRRQGNTVALAGYIMHRFRSDLNYAEFSINGAAKWLNMPPRSVARSRAYLQDRGWIRCILVQTNQTNGWAANRYILCGGPDDLALEEHEPSDAGDSEEPLT